MSISIPELSNSEYRSLIQDTKKKDPEFFNAVTNYIDEKSDQFLVNMENSDECYETWSKLSIDAKVETLLICINMDLSFFKTSKLPIDEILPGLLKVFSEMMRRKLIKEEKDEIVVDPEYQDLLDEALRIIDSEE